MREGPLAELFRATEAAQRHAKKDDYAQQQLPTEPEPEPTPIRAVAPAPEPEPEERRAGARWLDPLPEQRARPAAARRRGGGAAGGRRAAASPRSRTSPRASRARATARRTSPCYASWASAAP